MPVEPEAARVAPEHVWLYSDGNVRLSPGVVPVIGDLGALLELLLLLGRRQDDVAVGPDQCARIPRGLVLLTARATGQIDVEPFASLVEFATALERFDSVDPHETLRALFAAADEPTQVALSVSAAQEPPALAPRSTEELALPSTEEIEDYEYQAPLGGGTRVGERAAHRGPNPVVAAATHVGGATDRECSRRSYNCARFSVAARRRSPPAGDDRCAHRAAISRARRRRPIRCGRRSLPAAPIIRLPSGRQSHRRRARIGR